MKTVRWVWLLTITAFLCATAASVALLVLPVYAGVSTDPATGAQIHTSATLLQVNGYRVLFPLAIPLLLTGLGLSAVNRSRRNAGDGKLALWIAAGGLGAFCLIALFSVGVFYAPSELMLLGAASLAMRASNTTSS